LLALAPLAFALFAAEESRAAVNVTLEGDSTMTVAAVGWNSTDFVIVVFQDATEKFIGIHKIRSIVDEGGKDRTRDVLENRKTIGTPPPEYKGKLVHRSFGIGKGLILGVLVAAIVAGIAAAHMQVTVF
jgi:hypothetical protein